MPSVEKSSDAFVKAKLLPEAKQASEQEGAPSSPSKQRRRADTATRKQQLSRLAGRFSLLSRGLMGDKSEMCWAVLEPGTGALNLWHYPPEEDWKHLDSEESTWQESFPKTSSSTTLSRLVGQTSSWPPKGPFKEFKLEMLGFVDSNPHFKNIFLSFKGTGGCWLTAHSQETFEAWMRVLECYDCDKHR